MKTTFAGGLGIAAMALASSVAQAGDHSDGFGTLTGNLGVASEYVFRGLPSSNGSAQVSGGVDWAHKNVYVGTWLSNVGKGISDGNGNGSIEADEVSDTGSEVDLYAGITFGDFDFGAIAYVFPGDEQARNSKLLEVYTGYNHGMFSGYVWYGLGAYGRSDDDYIYLEGNLAAPVGDDAELAFHAGYTIYHGDDYNFGNQRSTDQQVDLGLTLSVGSLWFGMTTILDNDTNQGANKRPRINIGYNWTFDDLMKIQLR